MSENDPDFTGQTLVGNDYSLAQMVQWYDDESEGYAGLGNNDRSQYEYGYHALNRVHGFDRIDVPARSNALGLGAAYGDELLPVADRLSSVAILDPSESMASQGSILPSTTWFKPRSDGRMEFESDSFDLITCLGALHHIPNVSFVVNELFRVLKPGGIALLREPIHSMGDWRAPRAGLTKRERGIPERLLNQFVTDAGFEIISNAYCVFGPLPRLLRRVRPSTRIYNNTYLTLVDKWLSRAFSFNARRYLRHRPIHKLAPTSVFFILQKPLDMPGDIG